jgi:hypothetical protein
MGAQDAPGHTSDPESEPLEAALTLPVDYRLCLGRPSDPMGVAWTNPIG